MLRGTRRPSARLAILTMDSLMTRQVAIIGDRFMLPEAFAQRLRAVCGDAIAIRTWQGEWPDAPIEHGYAVDGVEGLKEYFGSPEDVVDFVGDAEVLVT